MSCTNLHIGDFSNNISCKLSEIFTFLKKKNFNLRENLTRDWWEAWSASQ